MSDDIVVDVLRDILGELTRLAGTVEGLSLRIMSVTAAAQRIEEQAQEVAVDLAWSHQQADRVPEDAPPGAKADATALPTPDERWHR